MKNLKFSRLFAAALVVACLALTGCKPQNDEPGMFIPENTRVITQSDGIIGNWRGQEYSDKFEITTSNYNNYYSYNGDVLYYTTNNLYIREIDETSGYVYSQFYDGDKIGYNATVGQWYAIYYFDLTDDSVKISAANGPKGGCDTLKEVVEEFTVELGYMSEQEGKYSTCFRE